MMGQLVFSGCRSRVHLRMRIHAVHAMFIHCACHRLQLASVQAAENVTEIKNSTKGADASGEFSYCSCIHALTIHSCYANGSQTCITT